MRTKNLKISIDNPGGIDRSIAAIDRNPNVADRAEDIKKDPKSGRIVKRDGYQKLYTEREHWQEYTTPSSLRFIDDAITGGGSTAYSSVGRKCIASMESGGIKYAYAGYVYVKDGVGGFAQLIIHRGECDPASENEIVESATGWDSAQKTSHADARATAAVSLVNRNLWYLGDDDTGVVDPSTQVWVEFSMCTNSDRDRLFVAVVMRDDANATNVHRSVLRVFEITGLFTDDFAADATWTELYELIVDNADNDAITHDIDITCKDVSGEEYLHMVYGYYTEDGGDPYYFKHIKYEINDDVWGDTTDYTLAGYNLWGARLQYDELTNHVYLVYIAELIAAGTDYLKYRYWIHDADIDHGSAVDGNIADAPLISDAGEGYDSPKALCGACFSIDNNISDDGNRFYVIYRTAAQTLYFIPFSVTSIGTPIAVTAALSSTGDTTPVLPQEFICWDLVARDRVIAIYFSYASDDTIHVKYYVNDAGALTSPVEVHVGNDVVAHINTDRVYDSYAARRMAFLDLTTAGTVWDFKHLRQEKDAKEDEALIEAIHEYPMPQYLGTPIQTHVIQCSDNKFRKRNSTMWHWEELENTMDVDNAEEAWWRKLSPTVANGGLALADTPDADPRARFYDKGGVLRAGIGSGDGEVGIHYSLIDRYFFTNDAGNRVRDHFLDTSPLQPPTIDNLQAEVINDRGRSFTFINNEQVTDTIIANDLIGAAPSTNHHRYPNYRPFMTGDHKEEGEKEFTPDINFDGGQPTLNSELENVTSEIRAFYCALSFIYDGHQESQLFHISNDDGDYVSGGEYSNGNAGANALNRDAVWVGVSEHQGENYLVIQSYLALRLQIRKHNIVFTSYDDKPANQRLTGVRIWLAEVTDKMQRADESLFFPAKHVTISQKKMFKDEAWNGESEWTWDDPYYKLTVVIDMDDYLTGLLSGDYEQINGHSMVDFKYEAQKGLELSPFPEAYKFAEFFGNLLLIGNVKINGVIRKNRLMWCATRSRSGFGNKTPDVFPATHFKDFPYDIQGISRLDDQTAVIVGDRGVTLLDVPSMSFRDTPLTTVGATAPESIARITDDSGSSVAFIAGNTIRLFDGWDAAPVSPPIEADAEDADGVLGKGIAGLTTTSDAWIFLLKKYDMIFVFFPTEGITFVYDMQRKGWFQYAFDDSFVAGCVGVDGELDFTDGVYVYRFPYSDEDDGYHTSPLWRNFLRIPNEIELDLERHYAYYKVEGTSSEGLTVSLFIDRAGVAKTSDFVGSDEYINTKKLFPFGTKVKQDIAIQFTPETALKNTIFEIDHYQIEGKPMRRQ